VNQEDITVNLTTWPFEVGFYVKAGSKVTEGKKIGDGNGGSPLNKIDQNLKITIRSQDCVFCPYPKVDFACFVM